MKRRAYAKINLSLDVIAKREDGYHDLRTVMVPLQLHDLISLEIAEDYSFNANVRYLDEKKNNIIYQSIEEMRRRYGFKENFAVDLIKYIPTQAGLGGGSSDAASTIVLVDRLLKMFLSRSEMEDIAATIGKDVLFCLYGSAALVEGTGEIITPIDNNCDFEVLLIKPNQGISTKMAYGKLAEYDLIHHPAEGMIEALRIDDYKGVVANLGNSFEAVAGDLLPLVPKIKSELADFGFDGNLLCGSGSCVYGITRDKQLCDNAVEHFRKEYPYVWKTKVKRTKR